MKTKEYLNLTFVEKEKGIFVVGDKQNGEYKKWASCSN